MRRTVVHNQEQTLRVAVRLLIQNLTHQPPKWSNASSLLATPHHHAAMHVPHRQVLQCATALILGFYSPCSVRSWRLLVVTTLTRLDARLLVARKHVISWAQTLAFPIAPIQIQNPTCLLREQRIPRENPMLVLPRLDGILVQHPPNCAAANGLAQRLLRATGQISNR